MKLYYCVKFSRFYFFFFKKKNPTSFRFWSSKTLPKRWKGSCSQVLVAFFNKEMSDARREWSISNLEFYAMISPFWHLIRYSKCWETKRKKKKRQCRIKKLPIQSPTIIPIYYIKIIIPTYLHICSSPILSKIEYSSCRPMLSKIYYSSSQNNKQNIFKILSNKNINLVHLPLSGKNI